MTDERREVYNDEVRIESKGIYIRRIDMADMVYFGSSHGVRWSNMVNRRDDAKTKTSSSSSPEWLLAIRS